MNLELLQSVSEHHLLPLRKALRRGTFSSPRNCMVGEIDDCDVHVLDCDIIEPWGNDETAVQRTVLLIQDKGPRLPNFQLSANPFAWIPVLNSSTMGRYDRLRKWLGLATSQVSLLERQFGWHYTLLFCGRPASFAVIQRILGRVGLEYFALHPEWEVQTHDGYLLFWQESLCQVKDRPELVRKAFAIRHLLQQAAEAIAKRPPDEAA